MVPRGGKNTTKNFGVGGRDGKNEKIKVGGERWRV
jgi:hypothetical protein